jgi:hypothetical protein
MSNLRHVSLQIGIERIFPLAKIFTNLKKCHLQYDNLNIFIFVNKKLSNHPKIGCKPFFSLVELIEIVMELEKELAEFQRTFENDEILEIQFIF